MIKRIISCLILTLFLSTSAWAQTTAVKGVVSDNMGPIIGATIIVKGTQIGGTTNGKGEFTINVPSPKGKVLEISFIGYNKENYTLGDKLTDIKITLTAAINEIETTKVVAIGYGNVARGNLTGAISSITGKEIADVPVTSAIEAIKGRMPGVQVTSSDGSQDAEIMIRVRGGGSITQDNSPLYIVDGFPVETIRDIPPVDIESIDVLKDASSTAIYGSRGANGVIIITTKNAKAGKVSVSVNSNIQARTLSKKVGVMNPYEFVMMQYEFEASKGTTDYLKQYGDPSEFYIYKGYKGTDWQEEILGKTVYAKFFNASVTGGTTDVKYNTSFTQNIEPGVLIGNDQKMSNFNSKLNYSINKKLSLDFNLRFAQTVKNGSGTAGGNVVSALRTYPTKGLSDFMKMPETDEWDDENMTQDEIDNSVRYMPTEENQQNYKNNIKQSYYFNSALNWNITPWLSYRIQGGIVNNYETNKRFYGRLTSTAIKNGNRPLTELTNTKTPQWSVTNVLTYTHKVKNQYNLTVMAGQEVIENRKEQTFSRIKYFPFDIVADKAFNNFALGTPERNDSYLSAKDHMASFFGRVNFDYKNKYLFNVSLRADGSTKFRPGKQWGYFPAAAFAWRVSDEDFAKNINFLSNLKLRVGVGESGNNRIDDDLWRSSVYALSYDKAPGWGGTLNPYYAPASTSMTNPDIQWETTVTRNAGIDFGLFKGRLNGSFDAYWNTVKNVLYPQKLPSYAGYDNMISNVAQTSNKGVELALNAYIIQKKDFTLSANFNIGVNKNRIDKLSSGESEWRINSGSTDITPKEDYRVFLGKSVGQMYGYVYDGFYTVDDFNVVGGKYVLKPGIVSPGGLPVTLSPGAPKFKKLTPIDNSAANPYALTDKDMTIIGNANPKLSGGFGVSATYKGFDANLFFNYMYGFTVYNYNRLYLSSWWRNSSSTRYNIGSEFDLDQRFRLFDDMGNDLRYDPQVLKDFNANAKTYNPALMTSPIVNSYIMEDGSFLRLNTATVGYTVPSKLSQKIGMKSLRVYFSGFNLWCWSNYTGYDPEVNIQKGMTPNMDNGVYPRSRTYTVGLNINF